MSRRDGWMGAAAGAVLGATLLMSVDVGSVHAQDTGEALFREICAACHSIGDDRIVGPGLAGVLERRDRDWLVRKIDEPERLLSEGDSISAALVEEYGLPMPDPGLTADQAELVIAYLAEAESDPSTQVAGGAPDTTFTAEQARLGQVLFEGQQRLESGATACNACHDVARADVLGGGSLARSLDGVYGRLGPAGIEAILRAPPFPVMNRAYADGPLTEEEIKAFLAFLHESEVESDAAEPRPYGLFLAGTGILGSVLLGMLFTLTWRGRRRGPVSRKIFDRQIESR